jgi:hypothetical protein
MEPADNTVAIVAIGVSGGVALLGSVVTLIVARLQGRTEREHLDLQELRSVLDQAAEVLIKAGNKVNRANTAIRSAAKKGPAHNERADKEVKAAILAFGDVIDMHQRLALRLGLQHDVTESFHLAQVAIFLWMNADYNEGDASEVTDDQLAAMSEDWEHVKAARVVFLKEAHKLVGSRVHPAS